MFTFKLNPIIASAKHVGEIEFSFFHFGEIIFNIKFCIKSLFGWKIQFN